jgi:single-strand DNA-binding protein
MNSVSLVGSLGKDPEIKNTQSGTTICKFSLATNDGFGDKKKTNWHNIIAFGKTAENASKYLKKGSKCGILGEIEYSEYDKDGQKVYYTSIKVNKLEFLDSKNQSGQQQQYNAPQPQYNTPQGAGLPPVDEKDLPF